MSLEGYRERVERLARERQGEPILNGSIDHAAIIIEKMFSHARGTVNILSGALNARLYAREEVREQAKLFLLAGDTRLRILVDADEVQTNKHPLLVELEGFKGYELRTLPHDVAATLKFHFLVMDDDSYRLESDPGRHVAVAAFGDKSGARAMTTLFDRFWDEAAPDQFFDDRDTLAEVDA